MPDATEVLRQIDSYVRTTFGIAADDPDFRSDVHLFDHGYLDSFNTQELIEHIETTYNIKIGNNDLVKYPLNTLDEISRFIVDRQAGVR